MAPIVVGLCCIDWTVKSYKHCLAIWNDQRGYTHTIRSALHSCFAWNYGWLQSGTIAVAHLGERRDVQCCGLPSAFEKKCYEILILTEELTVSSFQNDVVSYTLCSIGLRPNEEELTQVGYSLDVLEKRMEKILVSRLMVHFISLVDSLQEAHCWSEGKWQAWKGLCLYLLHQLGYDHIKKQTYLYSPYWEWDKISVLYLVLVMHIRAIHVVEIKKKY